MIQRFSRQRKGHVLKCLSKIVLFSLGFLFQQSGDIQKTCVKSQPLTEGFSNYF